MKTVLIALVVIVIALVAFVGIPKIKIYTQVSRQSLTEQIDSALGEFTVKQTEAKTGIERLQKSVGKLQEGVRHIRSSGGWIG